MAMHNPKDEEDNDGDLIPEEEQESNDVHASQDEAPGAVIVRGRGDTKEHEQEEERGTTTAGGKG